MAAYQLPPLPQPLAVFDHTTARQTQTLVIKEKLLDNFDIKDLNGAPWMRVEAKLATVRGRKKFFDSRGGYLFDVTKEPLHLHTTFSLKDQNKREIMEVKSNFSRRSHGRFRATIGGISSWMADTMAQ